MIHSPLVIYKQKNFTSILPIWYCKTCSWKNALHNVCLMSTSTCEEQWKCDVPAVTIHTVLLRQQVAKLYESIKMYKIKLAYFTVLVVLINSCIFLAYKTHCICVIRVKSSILHPAFTSHQTRLQKRSSH